jgi:nucleoside-diphosphate-sugar epimerase
MICWCIFEHMKSKKLTLAIVGCGWLGLPLALKALESGQKVKGSTTSYSKVEELEKHGIESYLLRLPDHGPIPSTLMEADALIINIPPDRKSGSVIKEYGDAVALLIESARRVDMIKQVTFISSTSVYGRAEGLVDEKVIPMPESDSAKALVRAEKSIIESGLNYYILRFGGLAGPGRHPGRFLAGRKNVPAGNHSVNFLHLDDAVDSILHLMHRSTKSAVYNVASPRHPTKRTFYCQMAKEIKMEPPQFIESDDSTGREISSAVFINETGYRFHHPNPLDYSF